LANIPWKKGLLYLIHPMAIGFYITAITVTLTYDFYQHESTDESVDSGFTSVMMTAHQKSIDYRLRVRGPRPVAPNIGLITVDERAIETLGRFPWPRHIIAKGVENAAKLGAKVIAFDISFAEASVNPAAEVLNAAKQANVASSALEQTVNQLSPQLDNDDILGKTLAKHADRVVAGSFSAETTFPTWAPDMDFCLDLIFKMSPAAKQWDKEEVLITPADPYQPYMPGTLMEVFKDVLSVKEKELREKLGTPKSRNEEVLANSKVNSELRETCKTILDDFKEALNEQWSEVILKQEDPKSFKFQSYDEWLNDYRTKSFPNSLMYAFSWNLNTPSVAQGIKHTAYFNTEQDPDGTIRGKILLMRTGQSYFPALSLKAFLVASGFNVTPQMEVNAATGAKEIKKMEVTNNETGEPVFDIPVDGKGRLLLNYAGPQKMYPYMSFADLVSDSPDATIEQRVWDGNEKKWKLQERKVKKAEFVKDKIFIVGATAIGIYDLRVTPFEENYPGAETHLNAIDNMVTRKFFRTLPDERVYMPVILGTVGGILSIALTFLGALAGLLLSAGAFIGVYLFDQHYLFNKGMVVAVVWPLVLIVMQYVALTFYRYLTEERGKKELRQTFQKYVSPAIVEEILAHPKNIELGGKKTHLTVFFSDVRGFTTISEKLDPRALSDLLNSYLTPMTEIVFKNQGTLDKYMGDAIMAFFGAPIAYKDHAKYACRASLASLKKLFELQKQYEAKGLPSIDIGIGLNTGDVSVGNMGSETVRSYTVMGDAVNLASRLEGINKQYGTRIILSEMTYAEVKDNFICREVDLVRVKGKAQPVKIYELLNEEKPVDAKQAEMLKWFGEGFQFYQQQSWQKGLDSFSKVLEIIPSDELAKLYIQRCQDYITEPPESGWDGVFTMKTK
jgi:adenylate cyclase